jgi:uncharacterized spore protein YtfJ
VGETQNRPFQMRSKREVPVGVKAEIPVQKWRYSLAKKSIFAVMFFLLVASLGTAQGVPRKKAQPVQPSGISDLVDGMAQRLSRDLNAKTVIGEPIKVGSVTLIPILMIDVKFGSAATKAPSGATVPQSAGAQANLFYIGGEARPLGFVAISGKGTRFISLVKSDAK